jgi:hypothetical protein
VKVVQSARLESVLIKNKKREVIGLTTPQVPYKDIKKNTN